jgi:hypothetical protein
MKPIVLAVASLFLLPVAGRAATVLAAYDFADGLGPTSVAAGISATSVSVVVANMIFPNLFDGNPSPAVASRFWIGARDNGRYYAFSLTNSSTSAVPINGVTMDLRSAGPGTGPQGFAVMSSVDSFQTDLVTGTLDYSTRAWVHVDHQMDVLLDPGQTLEFRVTGWGANSVPPQGGHLIMDNIVVTAVPEPGTFIPAVLLMAAAFLRRRRPRNRIRVAGGGVRPGPIGRSQGGRGRC